MVTRGKKLTRLTVKGKTGFRNISGNPILILDERGERFYDTRQLLKRVQMFNLPEGNYFIAQGDIARMKQPIQYTLAPMPEKERNLSGNFADFDMYFVNNPSTGTVVPNTREKFYDHELKNLPLPFAMFIDEHENGHKYYVTENYCDRYAANKMLERGYNPSQISEAIIFTLSPDKVNRKEEIVKALLNANIQTDDFEKDFPNVQWNTEPLIANPLLFWQDWWNADTWMRWHAKVKEKYGQQRANEVFTIWWRKPIWGSPTTDFRQDDKFAKWAKAQGIDLFAGIGGAIGKIAGGGKNIVEGVGDAAKDTGNFIKFIGDHAVFIIVIAALIFLAVSLKRVRG